VTRTEASRRSNGPSAHDPAPPPGTPPIAHASLAVPAAPAIASPALPVGPAPATPGEAAPAKSKGRRFSARPDAGAWLQTAAALVWIPQAAVLAHAVQEISRAGPLPTIFACALAVLALGILRASLDAWGARRSFLGARRVLSDLRARTAAALAARSPLDTARPASGLAASAMGEQAEAIVPYLSRFRPARLRATLVPVVILLAVLPLSWAAALVLLLAAPQIPIFMALIGYRAKEASEQQMLEVGGMNAFLLDRLRGLATIRTLGAVDLTAARLHASAQSLKTRTMAVLRIAFLSSAVLELFSALGVALVATYVGFHLLDQMTFGAWGGKLTLAQGLFILLLAPAFFEPLRDLSAVWHDRAAGEAAFDALDAVTAPGLDLVGFDLPSVPAPTVAQAPPAATRPPDVRLTDLAFRHAGNGAAVFTGFNLAIASGRAVALLGPSGSGKSTLLSLIAGLAPADSGQILIDGVPLTADTADRLRQRMAWIGQTPHFFAGSLAANIRLGRPDITTDDVDAAMRFAALDTVASLQNGSIGEGGAGLSGGEGLRLALARAAATRAADLILADEPTAHLDAATAEEVTRGLLALAQGRTLIVATHDPVLASRLDQVIQLEQMIHGEDRT